MFERGQAKRITGSRTARLAPGRIPRLSLLLPVLLAALHAGSASAQPADRHGGPRERHEERRQHREDARYDRRDASHPERHRHLEERRERMTPEERRGLRRDVHEAGRDLYRRER